MRGRARGPASTSDRMTPSRGRLRAAALVLAALGCPACGGGENGQDERSRILRVPGSYATIQAAVNAARPGDLVLIRPGVYHENVTVGDGHERIVIRGLDRNRVVLDGRDRLGDGIAVHADGVAVENLTVRRYVVNGVVWSPAGESGGGRPVQGWRGSYITAYDNGLYGFTPSAPSTAASTTSTPPAILTAASTSVPATPVTPSSATRSPSATTSVTRPPTPAAT